MISQGSRTIVTASPGQGHARLQPCTLRSVISSRPQPTFRRHALAATPDDDLVGAEPEEPKARSGKDFEDPLETSKKDSSVSGSTDSSLPKDDSLVGKEVQGEKDQETDHFEEGKKTGVHQQ